MSSWSDHTTRTIRYTCVQGFLRCCCRLCVVVVSWGVQHSCYSDDATPGVWVSGWPEAGAWRCGRCAAPWPCEWARCEVASGERREREEGSASKDQFNGLMWRASDLFIVSSNTVQEAFPFKLKHPLLIRIRNLVFLNELDVVMFDMRILIFVEKSLFVAI